MIDKELRLECIKVAASGHRDWTAWHVIQQAMELYAWCIGADIEYVDNVPSLKPAADAAQPEG